jgi:hypothetical protein
MVVCVLFFFLKKESRDAAFPSFVCPQRVIIGRRFLGLVIHSACNLLQRKRRPPCHCPIVMSQRLRQR